ncbi:MAG: hypothetical protein K9J30_02980 [Bacteroidales bacterium]|nr:hypothetical protein [Bacteroidales bacterium]
MLVDFTYFKIKLRPVPFTTGAGKKFETTTCISFFDDSNKELAYHELAFCDAEDIYKAIEAGDDINLDECYIENFSLSLFRKSRKLKGETEITLNNFSARGTFFDSKIATDFSLAHFKGEEISFKNSRFIHGTTSFHKSHFEGNGKDFSNVIFKNGEVDFSNALFYPGNVTFKNSVFFDGIKNFQYTEFDSGNVEFSYTRFNKGDVNFINTNFGTGNTSFKGAQFGAGKIEFQFARFGDGDISFERTEFGDGKVDFRKVEFGTGKINFNRALFGNGDVTFEESELHESRITFKKTNFSVGDIHFEEANYKTSEVLLENAQFDDCNLFFSKSSFKKLSLISCHLDQYVDLRVLYCEYLDLSDTITRDIVDFSSYDHNVEIHCLNLAGMRLLGQIYIDWNENRVKEIISRQQTTTHAEKSEQFRILKENYGRIGNYKSEDLAYIQFKRNEQKADLEKALKKSKLSALWQLPLFGFKFLVIDRMGLYATSPLRVITSLILIYFTFSIIHFACPFLMNTSISCIPTDGTFYEKILNTFYYSLITFTTVGYGDCVPTGFLRSIAAIEGFIGPFMMSYFTVAFARKVLR